jgi:hypothetical protein
MGPGTSRPVRGSGTVWSCRGNGGSWGALTVSSTWSFAERRSGLTDLAGVHQVSRSPSLYGEPTMSPKKTSRKPVPTPRRPRVVPPPDDPAGRGDARPDSGDEADRLQAEARLRALKQVREMKRAGTGKDPNSST